MSSRYAIRVRLEGAVSDCWYCGVNRADPPRMKLGTFHGAYRFSSRTAAEGVAASIAAKSTAEHAQVDPVSG